MSNAPNAQNSNQNQNRNAETLEYVSVCPRQDMDGF